MRAVAPASTSIGRFDSYQPGGDFLVQMRPAPGEPDPSLGPFQEAVGDQPLELARPRRHAPSSPERLEVHPRAEAQPEQQPLLVQRLRPEPLAILLGQPSCLHRFEPAWCAPEIRGADRASALALI